MTSERANTPIITAHTLRHLLMCERRVWLDAHDIPPQEQPHTGCQHIYSLGNAHEDGSIESIAISSWDEGLAVTHDLITREVPGIMGAHLAHSAPLDLTATIYEVRVIADRLVRTYHQDEWVYSPVVIRQRHQPDAADWLALDVAVWLLGVLYGVMPPAELWLGADSAGRPHRRLVHEYDEERLMAALTRVCELLNDKTAPPVRIESHCKTCHWYPSCQAVAQREQRLDLLYGVSRTTRSNMQKAGITNLSHVVARSPDELQQIKGIGPKTAPRIRDNARAWLENRPVWCGILPDACRQGGWMFDLETYEVRGRTVPWCMGWCDGNGQTHMTLVAPVQLPEKLTLPDGQAVTLAPDSDSAWEVFAEAVEDTASPIFHWTGYDAAILRGSAPEAVRGQLEPRFYDLHATLKQIVSLPLKSTSIKPVSMHLGFEWPGYQDWFAALLDYRHWLESGSLEALARACMYQRADVQSMAHVWRWLVGNAPGDAVISPE